MYRIIGADGREYGPVEREQLRQWIAEGRANGETMAVAEGTSERKPLRTFPEFASCFPAARPPAAAVGAGLSFAPPRQTNGFAVAGMILGVIALPACCCCYGLPFNLLGIIFSVIALVQINQDPHRYDGKGMAIAGLILSAMSLVLAILMVLIFGTMQFWGAGSPQVHRL
jgi:hypothetical protein